MIIIIIIIIISHVDVTNILITDIFFILFLLNVSSILDVSFWDFPIQIQFEMYFT
jgi:hypothetical protein